MKYKLNIEKEFVDKENNETYKVGDNVIFEEKRAKELLSDERKLVSLNEIIKEESKQESPKKNKSNTVTDEELKKQNSDKKNPETEKPENGSEPNNKGKEGSLEEK